MRHGLTDKWTNDFEESPRGRDFGNSSCYHLRTLKDMFQNYTDQEHSFDEEASPEMSHLPGLCSVCGLANGIPDDIEDVAGSIWYDYLNGTLYRDYGGGVGIQAVGGTDHGSLLNLDAADAHTNYILLAGDTDVENLSTPLIEDLSTTSGDYSGDEIVSRGVHLTTPADHADDVITADLGVRWGRNHLSISDAGVVGDSSGSQPAGAYVTVSLGRGALTPIFDSANTTDGMSIGMCVLYDSTPPDNYEAGFLAYCITAGEFKLLGRNVT
jgi:hypothetical protein